jgi:hypothetical protein
MNKEGEGPDWVPVDELVSRISASLCYLEHHPPPLTSTTTSSRLLYDLHLPAGHDKDLYLQLVSVPLSSSSSLAHLSALEQHAYSYLEIEQSVPSPQVVSAYSQATAYILANTLPEHHNLLHYRLRDSRLCLQLTFANYIDNILCFLAFHPHFPRHFTLEHNNQHLGDAEEKKQEEKEEEKEKEEEEKERVEFVERTVHKKAYFAGFSVLICSLVIICISAIAGFWQVTSKNVLLSDIQTLCYMANERLSTKFISYINNAEAVSFVLKQDARLGLLDLNNSVTNSNEYVEKLLFSLIDTFTLPSIFVADLDGLFMLAGVFNNGTKYVLKSNPVNPKCTNFYRFDSNNEKNLSSVKEWSCSYSILSQKWLNITASKAYWTDQYSFIDQEIGLTLVDFELYNISHKSIIGINLRLRDISQNVFASFSNPFEGVSFALNSLSNQLLGSSPVEKQRYHQIIHPLVSDTPYVKSSYSAIYSRLNSSTAIHSVIDENLIVCSMKNLNNSLKFLSVTAFSRNDYEGNYDTVYGGSAALAVLVALFSFLIMLISNYQLKKAEKMSKKTSITTIPSVLELANQDTVTKRPLSSEKLKHHVETSETTKLEERRVSRLKFVFYLLTYGLFVIVSILFSLWFLWNYYAANEIYDVGESILSDFSDRVSIVLNDYLASLVSSVYVMKIMNANAKYPLGNSSKAISERDYSLYSMFSLFSGANMIEGIFIANSDGIFSSVVRNRSEASGFVITEILGADDLFSKTFSVKAPGKRDKYLFSSQTADRVRNKDWFKLALEINSNSTLLKVSDPFPLSNSEVGCFVSFSLSAKDSSNASVFASFLVSFRPFSNFLSKSVQDNFFSSGIWITNEKGTLLASHLKDEIQTIRNSTYLLNATSSLDEMISSTTSFAYYHFQNNYSEIVGSSFLKRDLESPLTLVDSVNLTLLPINFKIFHDFDRKVVEGDLNERSDFTLLILITVVILLILVSRGVRAYVKSFSAILTYPKSYNFEDMDASIAEKWYSRLYADILNGFISRWKKNPDTAYKPLLVTRLKDEMLESAKDKYFDARLRRDIALVSFMNTQEDWIYKLWMWNSSFMNRFIVNLALCVHIITPFFEEASQAQLRMNGLPTFAGVIELFCILIEFQDGISKTILFGRSLRVKYSFENVTARLMQYILLNIVILLIFIDLLLSWSLRFSFEYYVPLKVILILLEVEQVWKMLQTFVKTIFEARDVFTLYFTMLVVASIMGHILFRTIVNSNVVENSWSTFTRSFITAFIFFSTSDNFTDCVYPANDVSSVYCIFIVITLDY